MSLFQFQFKQYFMKYNKNRLMTKNRQQLKIEPTLFYKIVSVDNENLCLTMSKSVGRYCKPILSIFANLPTQRLRIVPTLKKNTCRIFTMHNGEALCMKPIKFTNGEYLKFQTYKNSDFENWMLESVEMGFYSEVSSTCKIKSTSDHYLDLRNQEAKQQNEIMIWSKTKSSTQVWKIVPI